MLKSRTSPSRRDSTKSASGKPGAVHERFEVLADIDRKEIFGGARVTRVVVEGEDWSAQSDAEHRWGEPEAMGYKVTTPELWRFTKLRQVK